MATSRKRRGSGNGDLPEGIIGLVGRFARQLPGAEFAEEQYHNIETRALRELKQRLDSVDERRLPAPENHQPARPLPTGRHPTLLLADLLERSIDQSSDEARLYLFSRMLQDLVPDEARILALLADGEPQPLIHIGLGPLIGSVKRVAENYSDLGKTAALKYRDMAPIYIRHLRHLGLLQTGPEKRQFDVQYQMLENDRLTRSVAEEAEKGSTTGIGVRYIRRVIRISPLGTDLWNTCNPGPAGD